MKHMCVTKINSWFQIRHTFVFNSILIVFGLLFVIQTLLLLNYLPKLIGQPESFPIKATCDLKNRSLIDNLCQTYDQLSQGGIDLYWRRCQIVQYQAIYYTDEPLFDKNKSVGECVYLYPQNIDASDLELPLIDKNYSCWLDVVNKLCYLFSPEEVKSFFYTFQIILGVLWLLVIAFFIYIYQISQKRHDFI